MTRGAAFFDARDFLLETRADYDAAVAGFTWPEVPADFNCVTDYFDVIAKGNNALALHLLEENGDSTTRTYAELARRSKQVAAAEG